MSISRAQRLRLGAFLIAGLFLLAIFAAIPFGFRLKNTTNTFIAYFEGESLSGLEQGATVKYSGVPIGQVDKISYLPKDLERVRVEMKIQSDFPMKVDMVATTGAMGITGLKYIEITGGTNEAAALKPGAEIATKISAFSSITGKAEAIVAKVELLLNHLNEISNPDSLRSIKQILDNVAGITDDVKGFVSETRPDIARITVTTNTLITRLDSIARDIKSVTARVEEGIRGDRIGNALAQVDSAATALRSVAENVALIVRQSREDFAAMMMNVRQASENADQLTRILVENPSLLLRSETQKERDF
ncbi:MAG: MCE family protein [Chitinispirillaceae bacterium]|nr:MCE family protein [Chitinispirillaceae bacterium]